MTPSAAILPDFPDSEQIRELRFHVRSLQHDLAATIASLETCLPLPAKDAAAMWRLRQTIADATAAIEHDARHHVQRALDLVSAVSDGADHSPVEVDPVPTPSITFATAPALDDARDQLATDLGVALAVLTRVQTSIAEVAMLRGNDATSLRPRVTSAADTLQRVAWPAALRCLALAQALHHAADPDAAATEARAEELATPVCEMALDGARSLDTCPRCGAPLTADDRTFDGSYCENCRTRFFEPASRTE